MLLLQPPVLHESSLGSGEEVLVTGPIGGTGGISDETQILIPRWFVL